MAGICTSPYPIEKVGDFPYPYPYPYPYPVNAGIPRQNGNGFEQYPRGQIYLPSLPVNIPIQNRHLLRKTLFGILFYLKMCTINTDIIIGETHDLCIRMCINFFP